MTFYEIEVTAPVRPVSEVQVTNVTGLRGPKGPPGDGANLAQHEASLDPHAAAKYAIIRQTNNSTVGRKIFIQMAGDPQPTGMVDGDILIREITS